MGKSAPFVFYYPTPFPICDETWTLENFNCDTINVNCSAGHDFRISRVDALIGSFKYCHYCRDDIDMEKNNMLHCSRGKGHGIIDGLFFWRK